MHGGAWREPGPETAVFDGKFERLGGELHTTSLLL